MEAFNLFRYSNEIDENTLLNDVAEYYHNSLKSNPKDLQLLQQLGITSPEAVTIFKMGTSDRSFGRILPDNNRKLGALIRGACQRIGIIKPNGREQFRGSFTACVIENGQVIHMYGHKRSNRLRPGTPIHTHLPNAKPGFFNRKAIDTCEEVIFCSTIFDALVFWSAGYMNVTSIYGDNWIQDESIFQQLKSSSVKRAIIAFPNTDEDRELADSLNEQLKQQGIDHYHFDLPLAMDVTAYAVKHTPASDSLGELIRKAGWVGKGQDSDSTVEDADIECETTGDDSGCPPAEDTTQHQDANESILPARVMPEVPEDIDFEVNDDAVFFTFNDRRYRVRGLSNNLSYDQLKVNIQVNKGYAMHVDIINLYKDTARNNFIKQSAIELPEIEDVIKQDLSKILLKLDVLRHENTTEVSKVKLDDVELSKPEIIEAKKLLESPNLIERILNAFEECGIVGEASTILLCYLAALSRKQPEPLNIIIQSTSAAGKSTLMDAVLSFVPEEDKYQYSAITGQALFYMGDLNLRHKILGFNEEGGVGKAVFPLKLIMSDGRLTISSTSKDPDSGRHVAREYHVEGPVMIFTTTTSIDIDQELLNRCLVLTVDEDRNQTRAIQEQQRFQETLPGMMAKQRREDILKLHRNAQRLLKPVKVINPYAEQLTFLDDKTRTRRDHKKYLTLIRTIALLHQYQREVKTTYLGGKQVSYIEVTLDDIALANSLVHDILGQSLDDLPPQTQRLLHLVEKMVKEECTSLGMDRNFYQFTRRDVRAYCGWGDTQLKVHLKRLEEMEYLLVKQGGRGKQIVYELLYNSEGKDGQPFLMGLLDVETLRQEENERKSALNTNLSGKSRPQVGKVLHPRRHKKKRFSVRNNKVLTGNDDLDEENTLLQKYNQSASYHSHGGSPSQGGYTL